MPLLMFLLLMMLFTVSSALAADNRGIVGRPNLQIHGTTPCLSKEQQPYAQLFVGAIPKQMNWMQL